MCNNVTTRASGRVVRAVAAFVLLSAVVAGADLSAVRSLLDEGKADEAIGLLVRETQENPAHETARIWLAEAYEKAGLPDKAIDTWEALMAVSRSEANLHTARKALARLRREHLEAQGPSADVEHHDPFKIPMPAIDWSGLDVVEDTRYLPPIPGHRYEVPPFVHETRHFTVYSTNERLSEVIGERAEAYLDFVIEKLFGGRAWALRFPIIVYRDRADYEQHGGPAGTGGVTGRHITGRTEKILLYQLESSGRSAARGRRAPSRSSGTGTGVWKYGIESVLPHELTHAVINEFFAGRPTPQWLHEAIAGRFEQTRDHYGEAARLARKVVAGEYFRMRDLFESPGYPERIELFYEQSAAVVLYLFEAGTEAMHAFLTELAEGHGHDAACAAALGIPQENAVEEFERRWVEWMKVRYVKDLDVSADDTQTADAGPSSAAIFLPWANEIDTIKNVTGWRKVSLDSLSEFAMIGLRESGGVAEAEKSDWSAEAGTLRCTVNGEGVSSLLAIRMHETAPAAIRCKARCVAGPEWRRRWLGFTQLDARRYDTQVVALAPLRDMEEHELIGVWADDLALYVDGKCVGRYPATVVGDQEADAAREIDYPLAFVAYGPMAIRDLEIAPIREFSKAPVVTAADDGRDQGRRDARRDRQTERRRRRGP